MRLVNVALSMMVFLAAVLAVSAPTVPAVAAPPASCAVASGTVTDFETPQGPRKVKYVVPEGATAATPMVVSIHGATGSSEIQERTTGWTPRARNGGFIVVYPQSKGESPGTVWDAAPGSADVAFVSEVIAGMHAAGCSTPATTYVNGFSMGAMVTARMLCERNELFAGAAMVSGVLPPEPGCTIPASKTVVVVHGRADDVVPFDGSLPQAFLQALVGGASLATFPGVDRVQMARLWEQAKGCPDPSATVVRSGRATETNWTGCGTAPTYAVTYAGTGHAWDPVGQPDWKTSDYIWAHMSPEVSAPPAVTPSAPAPAPVPAPTPTPVPVIVPPPPLPVPAVLTRGFFRVPPWVTWVGFHSPRRG